MDRNDSRIAPSPGTASDDAASPFNFQPGEAPDRLAFEPVPLRHRSDGLTPAKQREFVEALADTGVVREAAARVGISEQAVNRIRRRTDAWSFDRACEAAHMFGARRLRSVAWERAIEGTLKDRYYRGELIGQERVHDNRLLIYLLGKTGHLLEPPEEARAICDKWEPYMDALERGLPPPDFEGDPADDERDEDAEPGDDERAYCDEEGIWWTIFPPPEGFEGKEEGELGDPSYRRILTREEEAAVVAQEAARDEAEIARCCRLRDRYFSLPPRGARGFSIPMEAETSETSEPFASPSRIDGEGDQLKPGGGIEGEESTDLVPEPPAPARLPLHQSTGDSPPQAPQGEAEVHDDSRPPHPNRPPPAS